jgi:hypothetical protein
MEARRAGRGSTAKPKPKPLSGEIMMLMLSEAEDSGSEMPAPQHEAADKIDSKLDVKLRAVEVVCHSPHTLLSRAHAARFSDKSTLPTLSRCTSDFSPNHTHLTRTPASFIAHASLFLIDFLKFAPTLRHS